MNISVDGFNTIVREDGSELLLILLQKRPSLDKDGKFVEFTTAEVGSFVLSNDCATALAENLSQFFLRPSDESDSSASHK